MDEQKPMDDRWRELDELLGLTEPTPAPTPPTPAPAVEHAPRIEEAPPVPAEAPSSPPASYEGELDDDGDTEVMEQEPAELTSSETADESAAEPGAAEDDEDKPRRGRRRRRRGRRRGGDRDDANPDERKAASPQNGAHAAVEDDEPRGAPAPADSDEEPEEFEHEPSARRPLTVDDADFSNWDVPSWQDIIASLHRPDR